MTTPHPKTLDFTQLARVSNADGTTALLPAAAVNDGLAPLCDDQGRLITVLYNGSIISGPLSLADIGAVGIGLSVKATAGKLYQAWGNNASGALLWALLYDIAAGPPAGAPAVAALPVPNNGAFSWVFGEGLDFATGIFVAFSTGPNAYVAPAVGGWISALYR
jgi:hypothetical protein